MTTLTNFKKLLYIVLAILVVIAAAVAILKFNKPSNDELNLSPSEIAALNEDQRKRVLEGQLADLEQQEKNLRADASVSDRYILYIQLAEVRTALGNHQGALDALGKIAEERQGNTRVWQTYSMAYKNMGDTAKAKESIQKALDLDNELPVTWVKWLELNQELPNEELNTKYREAITLTKSNVDIMISYARFNERIGNKELAIAAWETAINVNSAKEAEYRAEIARLRQ